MSIFAVLRAHRTPRFRRRKAARYLSFTGRCGRMVLSFWALAFLLGAVVTLWCGMVFAAFLVGCVTG